MAKQTQIEKAIANLQAEIDVLQMAMATLKKFQQTKTSTRRPRPVSLAKAE